MGMSELTGFIDHTVDELGCHRGQDSVKELALRVVVWPPVIRQVSQEILDARSLRPDGPNPELWPIWYEKLRNTLSVDDELLVPEDLLHETERTPALLGEEELHVVTHIAEEVRFAPIRWKVFDLEAEVLT